MSPQPPTDQEAKARMGRSKSSKETKDLHTVNADPRAAVLLSQIKHAGVFVDVSQIIKLNSKILGKSLYMASDFADFANRSCDLFH